MASESPGGEAIQLALRVIAVLEGLGVPAWVGGSLATSIYGIPRATQDADLVADLPADRVAPFIAALGDEFYADQERILDGVRRRASFNLIHLPTMFKVDVFLLGTNRWARRERDRRQHLELHEAGLTIPVASAEDMVIHKLVWFREGGEVSDRQWRDALGVVQVQGARLDRSYLRRTAAEAGVERLLSELFDEAAGGAAPL